MTHSASTFEAGRVIATHISNHSKNGRHTDAKNSEKVRELRFELNWDKAVEQRTRRVHNVYTCKKDQKPKEKTVLDPDPLGRICFLEKTIPRSLRIPAWEPSRALRICP